MMLWYGNGNGVIATCRRTVHAYLSVHSLSMSAKERIQYSGVHSLLVHQMDKASIEIILLEALAVAKGGLLKDYCAMRFVTLHCF